jgi:alkaline phosphatase
MGNHDVGWLKGGDEKITPGDLIGRGHAGEDITKQEFLEVTGTPHRYYSFSVRGFHFIVLDGNNAADGSAPQPGHDGVAGGYSIDATQKQWLAEDLARHKQKPKIVFCHEELHHTPTRGSGQGGDTPFPAVGKQGSYIDNGWELRKMFAEDGRVLACFFGHKHRNRWTIYDGTHYITMAATHWKSSFAAITIAGKLTITGFGGQRSYELSLPQWVVG